MAILIIVTYFFIGVGRNLPYQELYFFGLGIADVLFVSVLTVVLFGVRSRSALLSYAVSLRVPLASVGLLAAFAFVSLVFNSFLYGAKGKDLFEILKYAYAALVFLVTAYLGRSHFSTILVGFVSGVAASAVVAILNPMNPDVLGTPQMFNPNVIGNVLAASVVLSSFLILGSRPLLGGTLAVIAAVLSFFTFSKGTWLMSTLGLAACGLAIANVDVSARGLGWAKAGGAALLTGVVVIVYQYWDLVSLVVSAKIAATDFDATAAEGGSFSARAGLMLSATLMFLSNPLLGVGISNFETVNASLETVLGNAYYDDDNPNSAWFYVLACMGLPAFLCFLLVFYWFLTRVALAPALSGAHRPMYVFLVGAVFAIGGSVQVEMLTAYYYWVALGVTAAWTRESIADAVVTRPMLAAGGNSQVG
jgi:branched-subunit amino acid transport protein